MHKFLATTAVLALATAAAQAAPTLTLVLGVGSSSSTAATATSSLVSSPGSTIKVYVFAKTNTLQDPSSNSSIDSNGNGFQDESSQDDNALTAQTSAGGIRGMEVNIANAILNSTNYTSNAFSSTISQNFTKVNASKTADGGTGFYESGLSFSDTSSFNDTTMGTPESTTLQQTGAFAGYDLITTETWTLSSGSVGGTLVPTVIGPTWYDSTSGGTFFNGVYTTTNTSNAVVTVPEPASISLLGIGALSLVARRRRA